LAAALLGLLYFLAKGFYAKAWANASILSASYKRPAWHAAMGNFSPSVRGFMQKDLLTLNRDTVEKGSLLILIPLAFVYLYSMHILDIQVKNTNIGGILPFMYLYLFNFFYSAVVISGLSGRWVFPSVSLEGNNFKLIKGSSASLNDFLKAKFLLGFIPLLLLGQILILGSSVILHLQFIFILVSAVTMVLLSWGITIICLILGMSEADFSIREPLDFALSYKGFLCLVWELAFTAVVIVLVGLPTALFLHKGLSAIFIFSLGISFFMVLVIVNALRGIYKSSLIALSKKEI
jgi:ABC-2 type transport system permease protein